MTAGRPVVAVLRALPGLGDLLCAVPALDHLRAARPDAHITLVGLDGARWFADRYPELVDELVVLPWWPGLVPGPPDQAGAAAAVAAVRRQGPELVIQLHGSGPGSNQLAGCLGRRRLVVAARPTAPVPAGAERVRWDDHRSEVLLCLDVAAAATGRPVGGSDPAGPAGRLRFPLRDADRHELAELRGRHPALEGRYAVLHPGGTLPDRRWAPEGFAAVARHLAARGLGVAVTGTAAEAGVVAAVSAGAGAGVAVPLAGATTLGGLAALLAGAEVVVTNDTGTSHLAAAVGTPGVVVFLVTDPARWAPLDRRRHTVVDGRDGRDITPEVLAATD